MELIQEVEVSYFRSFYKFKARELKNLNVVFGKNDSGKSNLIRALNLFFSGRIDGVYDYEFPVDFCDARAAEAKDSEDVRKFLYVKITFNTPPSFQKSLGKSFYVKRQWTVSRGDAYIEEISSSIPNSKKHIVTRFLNKIRFIHIPAIKDITIFEMLLDYIHESIAESMDFSKAVDDFSGNIQALTSSLFSYLPQDVSAGTRMGAPTQLSQLFQALDFETDSVSGGSPKSLTRQRGDGVKVRHIPELLRFISQNDRYEYHIWGLEEPENSLDFVAQQAEARRVLEISELGSVQIFVTTHSPSFYLLDSQSVEKIYIRKDGRGLSDSLQGKALKNLDAIQAMSEGFYLPSVAKALENLASLEEQKNDAERNSAQLNEIIINLSRPVVLTEGRSDARILQHAWSVLRGEQKYDFRSCETGDGTGTGNGGALQLATCLKGVAYDHIHPVIGIFDYDVDGDNAFKLDRNFLSYEVDGVTTKRSELGRSYAFCLPAPDFRDECRKHMNLPIEFMFADEVLARTVDGVGLGLSRKLAYANVGRERISMELQDFTHFKDVTENKTYFAEKVVPTLERADFLAFEKVFRVIDEIVVFDTARVSANRG